jgi:hypothetical protein
MLGLFLNLYEHASVVAGMIGGCVRAEIARDLNHFLEWVPYAGPTPRVAHVVTPCNGFGQILSFSNPTMGGVPKVWLTRTIAISPLRTNRGILIAAK